MLKPEARLERLMQGSLIATWVLCEHAGLRHIVRELACST